MVQKFLLLACLLLVLPLGVQPVFAANPVMIQQQDPGTELWDAVRQRTNNPDNPDGSSATEGDTRSQVRGVDSTVLIHAGGDAWRHYRMGELIPLAAQVLGYVALGILVFRLVRGKIKIKSGRSPHKIKRFSTFQRYVHWITAILFVALAISGIFLMFGRFLMPYVGDGMGGFVMFWLKRLHDFAGPAFAGALLVMTFTFLKGNFPHWRDIIWVFKGGGLLGGHAPAGRYNAGEKGWYWAAVVIGAAVVVSGFVLDFPNFGQSRETMSYYHWIHSISTVVIMAASMGHIYMGTIAMEGAFEAMATGYCDANWAKEHHDVWYEEMVLAGKVGATAEEDLPPAEPRSKEALSS